MNHPDDTLIADTLGSGAPRPVIAPAVAHDDMWGSASLTGGPGGARGQPDALPSRLGRYHVIGRLGSGGMGVVFTAYDPDLDRKVAIKLLRTDHGGRDSQIRLLREAQALARLSHPNVVQIYDTDAFGEQVFIAMEFIRGHDLHGWLTASTRSVDEILRVFLDAGRGLAAAHDAGLVHRDFKPDNVLVGFDGRVCVADFGLARDGGDEVAGASAGPSPGRPLDMSLTATGAVLGTPTYMSPEQHEGRVADARSDQFSFCVALWAALYGRRPFAGETHTEIALAVTRGRLQEPPADARAPRRFLDVLRRGLSVDPERRYPNMHALLAALAPAPRRSRGRWLTAAALAGLTGGAGLAFASWRASEAQACSGGGLAIAAAWDDDDRAAVTSTLADAPDPGLAPRVLAGLDAYASGWVAAHRDACLAHRRGEQSSALLDGRMRCLQRRSGALAGAVRLLSERSAESLDAAQVVARLPALAPCDDVAVVLAEVPAPDDPALAAAVAAGEERLIAARTRFNAGDVRGAESLAEAALVEARRLEFRPLLAETLLTLAIIETAGPSGADSAGHLEESTAVAVAVHHDAVAAEAFARRIFLEVAHRDAPRLDAALAQIPLARGFAERLPNPAAALARVAHNEGSVQLARGDRARAAEAFARAVAESEHAVDVDPIERASYLADLALTTDDSQVRERLLTRGEEGLTAVLGPDHALVLELRRIRASLTSDLAAAGALLAPTCKTLRERYPEDADGCAHCHYMLGHIEARLGRLAEAQLALATVRSCADGQPPNARCHLFAHGATALAASLVGADAEALAAAEAGIALFAAQRHLSWIAAELAELELTRGRALLALRRPEEAIVALERAVADLAAPHSAERHTLPQLWLADARTLLARARDESAHAEPRR